MSQQELPKEWLKIIAKSWADEGFKQRLLDDPAGVLAEERLKLPFGDGVNIKIMENSADTIHLVLPAEPTENDAQEVEERLSAGVFW